MKSLLDRSTIAFAIAAVIACGAIFILLELGVNHAVAVGASVLSLSASVYAAWAANRQLRYARAQEQRDLERAAEEREARLREIKPHVTAIAEVVGPDEGLRRGYPISSATRLAVTIKNAGPGVATDVRLTLAGGSAAGIPRSMGALGVGQSEVDLSYLDVDVAGIPTPHGPPETISVDNAGDGRCDGQYTLRKVPGSHPPRWVRGEVREPRPADGGAK